MTRLPVVPALLLVASACYFGSSPSQYPAAQSPHGVPVQIVTTRGAPLRAELLAVTDTALWVYGPPGVMLVPFASMTNLEIRQPRMRWQRGQVRSARDTEIMRLHSRFPQGISDELLAQLLAKYEQPDLVVVER